jgi:hypothetical protein
MKTANRFIMIGVIDYEKYKQKQDQYSGTKNAICYFGFNGQKYPSGET